MGSFNYEGLDSENIHFELAQVLLCWFSMIKTLPIGKRFLILAFKWSTTSGTQLQLKREGENDMWND